MLTSWILTGRIYHRKVYLVLFFILLASKVNLDYLRKSEQANRKNDFTIYYVNNNI